MKKLISILNRNSNKVLPLMDQALVSASNFFIAVIIARKSGNELLGQFALLWLSFFFVQGLFNAFIGLPFLVLSNKIKNKKSFNEENLKIMDSLLVIILILGELFVTILSHLEFLPTKHNLYFLVPLAVVLMVRHEQIRRLLISTNKFSKLLKIDALAYGGQVVFLIVLAVGFHISLDTIFITITVLALFSNVYFQITAHKGLQFTKWDKDILKMNWTYSKYLIATHLTQWFSANILLISLAAISGPFAVGIVRIIQNLMGVLHIGFTVLENVVPAKASFLLNQYTMDHFRTYFTKVVRISSLFFVAALFLFFLLKDEILYLFYGISENSYHGYFNLYIGLYLLVFTSTLIQIYMKTLELIKGIFIAYIFNLLIALTIGRLLVSNFGINGFIFSLLILQVSGIAIYFFHIKYSKYAKKDHSYHLR